MVGRFAPVPNPVERKRKRLRAAPPRQASKQASKRASEQERESIRTNRCQGLSMFSDRRQPHVFVALTKMCSMSALLQNSVVFFATVSCLL